MIDTQLEFDEMVQFVESIMSNLHEGNALDLKSEKHGLRFFMVETDRLIRVRQLFGSHHGHLHMVGCPLSSLHSSDGALTVPCILRILSSSATLACPRESVSSTNRSDVEPGGLHTKGL